MGSKQQLRGITMSEVYADVWTLFDLRTRAILYLSATESIGLNRSSLRQAHDGLLPFSEEQLASYAARFPETFFAHHCDLDWGAVEPSPLLLPSFKSFKIESVQPGFVYYVEYSLSGRYSHPVRTYVTVHERRMLLLDTWDYEEVLALGNDGLCYYIH